MKENHTKFLELRQKYPVFYFHDYVIEEKEDVVTIFYHFEIEGLENFEIPITLNKKDFDIKKLEEPFTRNLIFHIGLVEVISYWKCTCSPKVVIECGYLDDAQIAWFKKLYYYGLGEFFYTNGIDTTMDDFMQIEIRHEKDTIEIPHFSGKGNMILIGGGKDSCVSLSLLQGEHDDNCCFIMNPKPVLLDCAHQAGYDENSIITVMRQIDRAHLIPLNEQGFLNGHTPFSALVAFLSYLCAYLTGKKYIVLSNESSANESNVVGKKVNHQYSKSYEFENDFYTYTKDHFEIDIKYFSFLRPLSEFQIAMLFSHFEEYHPIFKSCNEGSKKEPWRWCCMCSKCLFVYIILSPFLYKEKLVSIFGEDMFEKESLLQTFIELTGNGANKPFDCVGTYDEVNYALTFTMDHILASNQELPYLLKYYHENLKHFDLTYDLRTTYNEEHNLDPEFEAIIKEALLKYAK